MYKRKVRMQEISAVQEYVDVDVDGGSYTRADISRLLTDDEVKDVVGKLKKVYIAIRASGVGDCTVK